MAEKQKENYLTDGAIDNTMKRKLIFIILICLAVAVFTITRIGMIMINENDDWQKAANQGQFRKSVIPASRGSIYTSDKYGESTLLAEGATIYNVYIDPHLFSLELKTINDAQEKSGNKKIDTSAATENMVNFLAERLSIDPQKIRDAITQTDKGHIYLKKKAPQTIIADIVNYTANFGDPDPADGKREGKNINSIGIEEVSQRYYPQNSLAAAVVGFMTENDKFGVEYSYDSYLAGTDGVVLGAFDNSGKQMPYRETYRKEAIDGGDVYLTIDYALQSIVEKYNEEMANAHETASRSTAILMNAKTGAILAMDTYPRFDLNDPYSISAADYTLTTGYYIKNEVGKYVCQDSPETPFTNDRYAKSILNERLHINTLSQYSLNDLPDEYADPFWDAISTQWRNKAIADMYVPGSVFKVFTSAAAFEEGKLGLEDSFGCPGFKVVCGQTINCHQTGGHGAQNFTTALMNSCNPAFMTIGERLGMTKFLEYLDKFGLTEGMKTGIDLPGEITGQTITPTGVEKMVSRGEDPELTLEVSSFGQNNKLTPIQMITMYAAAINGGNLVTPHVVDKVIGTGEKEGQIIFEYGTKVKGQAISTISSKTLAECLANVVDNKTDSNAYIKGYSIGGKSGTSQKKDEYNKDKADSGVSDDEYVASYICFAPADDPEIILLVMADQPNKANQYYGSKVAVPTAKKILTEALPYLGFYPNYSQEELDQLAISMPLVVGKGRDDATKTLSDLNLSPISIGEGDTVLRQFPEYGDRVGRHGKVYLYFDNSSPETTIVPNVIGMTLQEANIALTNADINFIHSSASTDQGNAIVHSQSAPPDTRIFKGAIIEITALINTSSE